MWALIFNGNSVVRCGSLLLIGDQCSVGVIVIKGGGGGWTIFFPGGFGRKIRYNIHWIISNNYVISLLK